MRCVATAEHLLASPDGGEIGPALDAVLERRDGPVTLLIHGYRYCPFHTPSPRDPVIRDPHRLIYAGDPAVACDRTQSWPRHLARTGPVIGIGWPAMHEGRGDWAGLRGFAAVYRRADAVGRQVARLLDEIAACDPGRDIDIVAHSLGARVALAALHRAARAQPRHLLLWGAAERVPVAEAALRSAGSETRVTHVRARANAHFDRLFALAAPGAGVALGLRDQIAGMRCITIDDAGTERALLAAGLPLGPRPAGACHWSFYTRAGTARLNGTLLDDPASVDAALATNRTGMETERRFGLPAIWRPRQAAIRPT